jgi:hypothetical protein
MTKKDKPDLEINKVEDFLSEIQPKLALEVRGEAR